MPGALLPAPAAGALARAGFARWATYRQAALAGMFTNTVFGVIKLSVLFAVIDETGGTVAGYDHASLSTYVWVSPGPDRGRLRVRLVRAGAAGAHG